MNMLTAIYDEKCSTATLGLAVRGTPAHGPWRPPHVGRYHRARSQLRMSLVGWLAGIISGVGILSISAFAGTPDPSTLHELPVSKRMPRIRSEAMATTTEPSIAPSWLALAQRTPLMSPTDIERAARIVALAPGRRIAATGDLIHVRGDALPPGTLLELRRLMAPVMDPDTGLPIALAARRIGRARTLHAAPVSPVPPVLHALQVMQVIEASEELTVGDLLVHAVTPASMTAFPSTPNSAPNSAPESAPDSAPDSAFSSPSGSARSSALASAPAHPPAIVPHAAGAVQGRIAAVLHDSGWASPQQIVALNRGARHGLNAGSVVQVVRPVRIGPHDAPPPITPTLITPALGIDDTLATLLVVDVLDHAALAIVMRATDTFGAGARFISAFSAVSSSTPTAMSAPVPVPSPMSAPMPALTPTLVPEAATAAVGATR